MLAADPSTTVCYTFVSKVMQMLANNLLLFSDRRELEEHRKKVARIYYNLLQSFHSGATIERGKEHHESSSQIFTLGEPGQKIQESKRTFSSIHGDSQTWLRQIGR